MGTKNTTAGQQNKMSKKQEDDLEAKFEAGLKVGAEDTRYAIARYMADCCGVYPPREVGHPG